MVHGEKRWGRLPETRHELWGALIDAGLSAPKKIHDELKNSTEAGVKDFYKPGLKTTFNAAAPAAIGVAIDVPLMYIMRRLVRLLTPASSEGF